MTLILAVLVVFAVAAVAANVVFRWMDHRWPDDLPLEPVSSPMIVNLPSGTAFRGVGRRDGSVYRLVQVVALDGNGGETPVDGEVVIERDAAEFVQVL